MKNTTEATEILKNRYKRNPRGKVVKTRDAEHNARYITYERWDFLWYTGFTTIPICRWVWWPRYYWGDWDRSFRFLWLSLSWRKGWSYVEREDWKSQNAMARVTNQMLDNMCMKHDRLE
jgi:hypothetical protein